MGRENVGGIDMDAQIELGSFEKSVAALNKSMEAIDARTKGVEKSFLGVENSSKVAAGSIQALEERSKVLRQQLEKLDPQTKQFTDTAKRLNIVLTELKYAKDQAAKATVGLTGGMDKASIASKALGVTLGLLGAQSIQAAIAKLSQLTHESIDLAIHLEGVEARARAIFGEAFPRVSAEADRLAQSFRRSDSDVLEFMTGFGSMLDSLGVAPSQVEKASGALAQLTIALGKAFPDISDVQLYEKLTQAIGGNYKGLNQLNIKINDNLLAEFARQKVTKTKLTDMSEEQKAMLRVLYLLDQTDKQQLAAADSAGKLGDKSKTAAAAWQDLKEEFAKDVAKPAAGFMGVLTDALVLARTEIGKLMQAWAGFKNFLAANAPKTSGILGLALPGGAGGVLGRFLKNASAVASPVVTPPALPGAGELTGGLPADFWKPGAGAGGGGGENKALQDAKNLTSEIDRVTKEILDSQTKLAKENLDRLKTMRDELLLRQKMGIITKDELKDLATLNKRIEFGGDKVQEATEAWQKQDDVVKKLRDTTQKINDDIIKQRKELDKTLADIDAEAARKKADILKDSQRSREDKIADLLREQDDLNGRLVRGEGLNPEQQRRMQDVADMLKKAQAETPDQFKKGQDISKLDDLQMIDFSANQKLDDAAAETKQKKIEAVTDANAKLQDSVTELTQAEMELAAAEGTLTVRKTELTQALDALRVSTGASYEAMYKATQTSVAGQIAELDKYIAKLNQVKAADAGLSAKLADPFGVGAVKRAGGGMVYGSGGPTGDKIPAWLSDGEGIVRNVAVRHYGGPAFINALNSLSLRLPKFAHGGTVSNNVNNARNATITNNYYGDTARAMAPLTWYHVRMGMR